jgi:hypothetical protein
MSQCAPTQHNNKGGGEQLTVNEALKDKNIMQNRTLNTKLPLYLYVSAYGNKFKIFT